MRRASRPPRERGEACASHQQGAHHRTPARCAPRSRSRPDDEIPFCFYRSTDAIAAGGHRGERRGKALRCDVDLAVLCADPLGHVRLVLMDRLGLALGRDVDVIDLRPAAPHLAWEIVTTGRVIAEHDELAVEQFVRSARFAAEDAAQRDRMILLAQVGQVGGSTR